MKKIFITALAALAIAGSSRAADIRLFASNLGNGLTAQGGTPAVTNATVRFGVFPAGFDYASNATDFNALDSAFVEVATVTGPLSVANASGFFDISAVADGSATYEGTPYDSSSGTTTNQPGDVAGEKIHIFVRTASQVAVFSTNQVWPDNDDIVTDAIVTPDAGTAGLVAHIGALANGADIGAGASSHTLVGANIAPIVNVSRSPSTGSLLVNSATVTFTANLTEGTSPVTYQWFRNGAAISGATSATYTIPALQLTLSSRGNYHVVATNVVGSSPSSPVNLEVHTLKPTIITQPTNRIAAAGSAVNLSVVAVGEGSLTYQWKKGLANIGGATSATYTVAANLVDSGTYSCVVTNANGFIATTSANVIVVNTAPRTVDAALGLNLKLDAAMSGTGATFLWKNNGVTLSNGGRITGATAASLNISALQVADAPGPYTCDVTAYGTTITTGAVTLTTFSPVPVINNPISAPDAIVGSSYTFQVPYDLDVRRKPTRFALLAGTGPLPAGLILNAVTGAITGRPTSVGLVGGTLTRTLRVVASNTAGSVTSDPFTITVRALPVNRTGMFNGLISRGTTTFGAPRTGVWANNGGFFTITVLPTTGAMSASFTIDNKRYAATGFYTVVGTDPSTATYTATFPINVARTLGAAPQPATVWTVNFSTSGDLITSGTINQAGGAESLTFSGWRNVWSATNPATKYTNGTVATAYTTYNVGMSLPDASPLLSESSVPQGHGYFSFKPTHLGVAAMTGRTADGETVTSSCNIGPNGQAYFFRSMYAYAATTLERGSLHGGFTIDEAVNASPSDNTIAASFTWNRPVDIRSITTAVGRTYAAGFGSTDGIALSVYGGAYIAPVSPKLLLGLNPGSTVANADLDFEILGAAVTPALDVNLRVAGTTASPVNTVLAPNPALVTIAAVGSTGVFTGTLTTTAPFAGKPTYQGLVVPVAGELRGVGYFLLPQSGSTTATILSGSVDLMKK
jgi:hypothetical protein